MTRILNLPLRIRLTLWFVFSLAVILLLFASFLYWQTERTLIRQVDTALALAASQAQLTVGRAGDRLELQTQNGSDGRRLQDDFVIQLLAPDGVAWASLSREDEFPQLGIEGAGFFTRQVDGEPWRVYNFPIEIEGVDGWLQIAQELDQVERTLIGLQLQIFWGLPVALLLAGLGGFFLALRALKPIGDITATAQAISGSDLVSRMNYDGPADEIGRLAATFDRMLDRLERAFDRERRFTGDAAHELRTPLAALKGRIGVTLSQPRTPAAYVETLQEMEEQVDRLSRLANDLLFMARLEQAHLALAEEPINAAYLLGATIDQLRPLADAKQITFEEAVAKDVVLLGEMDLLIRLFFNLLDNAVKYSPAGGRVIVSGECRENRVTITVQDSGPGIPAAHLPRVFDRFYRVEGDRAREPAGLSRSGAGLGLAIAREIAQLHDGRLTVESRAGEGARFLAVLPGRCDS